MSLTTEEADCLASGVGLKDLAFQVNPYAAGG